MRRNWIRRGFIGLLVICMTLSCMPAFADAASDGVPDVQVATAKDGYTGRFPDVTRTNDGLVAAFYWNKISAHAPWSYGDPLGKIMITHGSADAQTWSEPAVLVSPEKLAGWGLGIWRDSSNNLYYNATDAAAHNAQIDIEARDPNLITMNDGTVVFTFFTRLPDTAVFNGYTFQKTSINYTYGRTYIMYSKDNGYSWSQPTEITCNFLDKGCAKRGDIAVYSDDSLLVPLYGYSSTVGNTFTTANVRAVLDNNGNWSFPTEYSTHDFEGTSEEGAFHLDNTEVSFGVTTDGDKIDVTYALCRANGDFLVSYNKGANWTLIGNQTAISGRYTEQPSFYRIAGSNKLFVTWSESVSGGRSVYGKVYTPGTDWDSIQAQLLYEDSTGGDMADPTGIQLKNGKLFTIFYDVGAGCIGGVINTVDELSQKTIPAKVDNSIPSTVVFEENFEKRTVDKPYNNATEGAPNAPNVNGWFWTNDLTRVRSEAVGTDGTNNYLNLAAPFYKTDGRTFDHTALKISKAAAGNCAWQFDYAFTSGVQDGYQSLDLTLANETALTSGAETIDDPFTVQLYQSATGEKAIRILYGATVIKTAPAAFEVGKTNTIRIIRAGNTLNIKTWVAGAKEPADDTMAFTSNILRTTGYTNIAYTSTDWTNTTTGASAPVASAWRGYIDNISISKFYTLTLNQTSMEMLLGADAPYQLVATLDPTGGKVTWSSDKETVATVKDGLVTAVGKGTANITATSGNLKAVCAVSVGQAPDEFLTSITNWVPVTENFEKSAVGAYAPTGAIVYTEPSLQPATPVVQTNADNNYLVLKGGGNSSGSSRLLMEGLSGDATVQFDFMMPYTCTGSQWQGFYVMFEGNTAVGQLRQWVSGTGDVAYGAETGNNSGKIRFTNGDAIIGINENVFKTGTDASWYTCKAVRTGNTLRMKVWKQGEAEPQGYSYIYTNKLLSGGTKLMLVYQAGGLAGTIADCYLDNIVVSKRTNFSVADNGSDTLTYAFDRDVTAERPVPTVIWNSSDENVVKVDATGKMTYTGVGTATITGTANNLTDDVQITVTQNNTPDRPVLNSSRSDSITINAVPGQMYSINGGLTWVKATDTQLSFTGLFTDSLYAITTYAPADGRLLASAVSDALYARTESASEVHTVYNVAGVAVANGTVTPEAAQAIAGDTMTFTLKPDVGYTLSRVSVNGTDVALSDVTCNDDGSFTYAVRILSATELRANFERAGSFENFRVHDLYTGFQDVDESAWYGTQNKGVIRTAMNLGIVDGCSDTEFIPMGNLKVNEAIKMACMVYSTYYDTGAQFDQTAGEHWYTCYVEYALEKGIIKAGDFADYTRYATRSEMAYIFANIMGDSGYVAINSLTYADLPDVSGNGKYDASILKLYNAGILEGRDGYVFDGGTNITRAETCAILARLCIPSGRIVF